MATMRNGWKVPRICPTLGFHEVAPDDTITVPDDEVEHWVAGDWEPADPATAKVAQAAADRRAAAFKALTTAEPAATEPATATVQTAAVAPAEPAKNSAPDAPEGTTP